MAISPAHRGTCGLKCSGLLMVPDPDAPAFFEEPDLCGKDRTQPEDIPAGLTTLVIGADPGPAAGLLHQGMGFWHARTFASCERSGGMRGDIYKRVINQNKVGRKVGRVFSTPSKNSDFLRSFGPKWRTGRNDEIFHPVSSRAKHPHKSGLFAFHFPSCSVLIRCGPRAK